MSRILGNNNVFGESGDLGLQPVKLPHVPMAGTAVIAECVLDGTETNFTFVIQQGPTAGGPWTSTGATMVVNDPGDFAPIIWWLRFSATERYVRLVTSDDSGTSQAVGVLWLDDPLVHWEPCP